MFIFLPLQVVNPNFLSSIKAKNALLRRIGYKDDKKSYIEKNTRLFLSHNLFTSKVFFSGSFYTST